MDPHNRSTLYTRRALRFSEPDYRGACDCCSPGYYVPAAGNQYLGTGHSYAPSEKSQKSPAAQMQRENTVQKTQEGQPREVNSAAAQPEASKKQTSKNDVERAVERVEDIFWQN